MKNLLACLFFLSVLTSCEGQTSGRFQSKSAADCKAVIESTPGLQILDVRTAEEFSGQHIDRAVNIDVNSPDFAKQVSRLDKTKPVLVYCLSGGRSKKAAKQLQEMGFKDVVELDGGIIKWNAAGYAGEADEWKGMSLEEYQKITTSDSRVLVNFYAEWCAPCKKMAPYLLKMQAENNSGVTIVRIDADKNKSLFQALKHQGLPVLTLYKDGASAWNHDGMMTETDLREKLKKI